MRRLRSRRRSGGRTYLKTYQALSYERLQAALLDLFGLTISQGGLMNLLRRAQGRFEAGREEAVAVLRRADVVASDETGVRIEGSNAFHWVFRCKAAVVRHAAPTRAASVVREMMDGHRPAVWLSDRYSAQQGHGLAQQTCLAHLARDVAYAVEASDDPVPFRLKLWLASAFELAAKQRVLVRPGARSPGQAAARTRPSSDLCRPPRRRCNHQHACERDLRPSVIQRMVTDGYRAMWAAQDEADVRTVVAIARLTPGTSTFGTILQTVSA